VGWLLALPLLLLAGFLLFFFRDPERAVKDLPDVVLSPADGRVLVAGPAGGPGATWRHHAAEGQIVVSEVISGGTTGARPAAASRADFVTTSARFCRITWVWQGRGRPPPRRRSVDGDFTRLDAGG
jgi:hypothetical protein